MFSKLNIYPCLRVKGILKILWYIWKKNAHKIKRLKLFLVLIIQYFCYFFKLFWKAEKSEPKCEKIFDLCNVKFFLLRTCTLLGTFISRNFSSFSWMFSFNFTGGRRGVAGRWLKDSRLKNTRFLVSWNTVFPTFSV